jgi:hypothetical protein
MASQVRLSEADTQTAANVGARVSKDLPTQVRLSQADSAGVESRLRLPIPLGDTAR